MVVSPLAGVLLIPLFGAGVSLLLSPLTKSIIAGVGALAGLLAGAISAGLLLFGGEPPGVHVVGGWLPGIGITIRLDGAAALLLLLVYGFAFLILLHTFGGGQRRGTFYGVFGIAVAGMAGVILSADLFNLFVFFEILSLSAAILIAFERSLPAMAAAFRYLLLATLSIALYLLGLFLLYRETGELSLLALAQRAPAASPRPVALGAVLIFAGVATRMALVPFHLWLPEAHAQAPTPVSALLSGLMLKSAFLASWRILSIMPGEHWLSLLALLGAVSAVYAAAAAMIQHDAKRLLAYSSISQIGYIATAAALAGLSGATYHLITHAAYKSLLFLIVGSWVHRVGARSLRELRSSVAFSRREDRYPLLLMLVTLLAAAGLPPLSGFVSKEVVSGMVKGSALYPLLQVSSVLMVAALARLATIALPPPRPETAPAAAAAAGAGQGAWAGTNPAPQQRPVQNQAASAAGTGQGDRRKPGSPGALLSAAALTLLFLPTPVLGLFPGALFDLLSIAGVAPEMEPGSIYGLSSVMGAVGSAAAGVALFLALRLAPLRRLTAMIASGSAGSDLAMALQALGAVAMVGVVYLGL